MNGVHIRRLTPQSDDRGSLTELLRSDWPEFPGFGQALVTVNLPGVIRAWHWHERQTDVIVAVRGRVQLTLYDARPGSATHGRLQELIVGEDNLLAVVVPPGVYHGYRTLGDEPALILNFPDRVYDYATPDEQRIPHDSPLVPYRWEHPGLA